MNNCTGITSLPEGLRFGQDLNLRRCTGLTSLPEGLKVGESLSLSGCTGITALPEGLKVNGNMTLTDCTGLTALPEGLQVGWNLNLEVCTGITALPESVFEWPKPNDDDIEKHNIYLAGSGLSEETLDWLRNQEFPYLRFHVDRARQDAFVSNAFEKLSEARYNRAVET